VIAAVKPVAQNDRAMLALVPHPDLFWGRNEPELIDERAVDRIAIAYDEGARSTIDRLFGAHLPFTLLSDERYRALQSLRRAYEPTYTEVRDYLVHECNVPLVLAARVALRHTRYATVES
jgi:hypothetical protein